MTDPREMWKSGKSLDEICKNENGTYNGLKMISAISNLPMEEIEAMFKRVKQLQSEGKTKEEIKDIIKSERKK